MGQRTIQGQTYSRKLMSNKNEKFVFRKFFQFIYFFGKLGAFCFHLTRVTQKKTWWFLITRGPESGHAKKGVNFRESIRWKPKMTMKTFENQRRFLYRQKFINWKLFYNFSQNFVWKINQYHGNRKWTSKLSKITTASKFYW